MNSSTLWSMLNPEDFEANIQYPLNCEFHELDDGFSVTLVCLPNIMDLESLEREMSRLEALLGTIVSQPNAKAVADVPFDGRKPPLRNGVLTASIAPRRRIDLPPALANVLSSVAKCSADKLDPDRPIAAIGIDSITAIRLSAKCREAGIALTIADIVACRTIGDLAARVIEVERQQVERQPKTSPPCLDHIVPEIDYQAVADIFPSERRGNLTVTRATPGMKWLICAWQKSRYAQFQYVFAYKMTQKIDPERLRSSWAEFTARHPILRSTFVSTKSHSDVHIATFSANKMGSSFAVEPFDDSSDDMDNLRTRMDAIVSCPPPIDGPQACGLLLNGSRSQYLLIRMHHFQYDAWSLALLIEDLCHIYLGQPSSVTSDYKGFMSTFAPTPENLRKQEEYWRSIFSPSFRPAYFPQLRPLVQEIVPRTNIVAKNAVHGVSTLEQRAQMHGVSLQSVLLACWAYIQSSYTSQEQATFGLWHAGRTGPVKDIDKLAFPCMNVLPMHTHLGSSSIIDVARGIQDDLRLRTPIVQQTDLQMIDKWIGGTGAPLCNVFVNLIRFASDGKETGLFESVDIPYTIPEGVPGPDPKIIDWIPMSNLIQDDVMVEIIVHPSEDTITMAIESAPAIMDMQLARKAVDCWSEMVGSLWESAPVDMRTMLM
jgi:aryl carrier-like protein